MGKMCSLSEVQYERKSRIIPGKEPRNTHVAHIATDQIKQMEFKEECRGSVCQSNDSIRQVFNEVSWKRESNGAETVSFTEVKSSMYKRRQRSLPPNPKSICDVEASVQAPNLHQIDGSTTLLRDTIRDSDTETASAIANEQNSDRQKSDR
ncbi:unnamed protein product [Clavelina lepadiformis]|uniref:Uncharacterized protein n=1 Tax=Clavelina lepadiformis TaxID=159417 RepID=A0ABP0FKW3_CLALP